MSYLDTIRLEFRVEHDISATEGGLNLYVLMDVTPEEVPDLLRRGAGYRPLSYPSPNIFTRLVSVKFVFG